MQLRVAGPLLASVGPALCRLVSFPPMLSDGRIKLGGTIGVRAYRDLILGLRRDLVLRRRARGQADVRHPTEVGLEELVVHLIRVRVGVRVCVRARVRVRINARVRVGSRRACRAPAPRPHAAPAQKRRR